MSIPRVPRHADFRKLAASGAHIGGVIALADLERIGAELLAHDGLVTVALGFGIDDEGHRVIDGHVEADLVLQCQRCLGPMRLGVAADVHLAMVWREEEIPALPQRLEGVVIGDEPGDLFALVEDELLLALPFAPSHAQGECAALEVPGDAAAAPDATQAEDEARENPFAVLAKYREPPH